MLLQSKHKLHQKKLQILTEIKLYIKNCKNNSIISCPAFNQNNIDTVGAGDTFFGICSLAIGSKIDNKISMLIASISASFAINQLGKKSYFNDKNLKKHLTHIFK